MAKERTEGELTHAGAVVLRGEGTQLRVLIVESSDGAAWVLPKGHIEARESMKETAQREVLEEAGVEATILHRIGVHRIGRKHIAYFAARFVRQGKPAEKRAHRWLPAADALATLTFDDARQVVRTALESAEMSARTSDGR